MRVVIDACVLYPTVLREIVLGLAGTGYFTPIWSERILGEWQRAAARQGQGDIARIEIRAASHQFPEALIPVSESTLGRLSLPDPDDVHVLAAAIDGSAGELLTLNLKDFPTNILSSEGIVRRDPDGFLVEAYHANADQVMAIVSDVLNRAARHGIDVSSPRSVLKRARVPRLGKALYPS